MKKDEVYLKDMLDAVDQILEYCKGFDYIKFANTKLVQDAVMRNLEILGEAAKKLSTGLREKNSDLPVKEAIGMRNLLVREYDYVNVDEVWKVVEEDLPNLASQLRKLL